MLFKTIDDLQKVLPFTANFEFDKLSPFIERAERELLIPFIGQAQYDELNDAYTAETDENDLYPALLKLLKYARQPVAHGGFLLYIPFGNLNIGKSGFSVTETSDTKIASQWRIEDMKSESRASYFSGIESMLTMMETDYTQYPEWVGCNEYCTYKEGFVNTAIAFQEYVDINQSRMLFTKVKPTMKRLEIDAIKSVIGEALFNEIKTQILNRNVSANNSRLMVFISRCICNFTIGESLRMRTVSWTDHGLQLISTSSSLTQVNEASMDLPRLEVIRSEFISIGKKAQQDLRDYLYANASTYPLFEADTTVYTPTENLNIENLPTRTTFFV